MEEWKKLLTPHYILAALTLVAAAAVKSHVLDPWPHLDALAQFFAVITGAGALKAAVVYQPPHVKSVLAKHDLTVAAALGEPPPAKAVEVVKAEITGEGASK